MREKENRGRGITFARFILIAIFSLIIASLSTFFASALPDNETFELKLELLNKSLSPYDYPSLKIGFRNASYHGVDISDDYELNVNFQSVENKYSGDSKYFGELKFPIIYPLSEYGRYSFYLKGKSDNGVISSSSYEHFKNLSSVGTSNSSNYSNKSGSKSGGQSIKPIPKDLKNNTVPKDSEIASIECDDVSVNIERRSYVLGEKVNIYIAAKTKDAPKSELSIINQNEIFRFAGELKDMQFVPQKTGAYILSIRCWGGDLATIGFVVRDNAPSDIAPRNSTSALGEMDNLNITVKTLIIKDSKGNSRIKSFRAYGVRHRDNLHAIGEKANERGSRTINDTLNETRSGFRESGHNEFNSNIASIQTDLPSDRASEMVFRSEIILSEIEGLESANMEINNLEILPGVDPSISIENVPADVVSIESNNVIDSYAMDLSSINFTNGTFRKIARGKELWKCKDWSFSEQKCFGEWQKIRDIVPGLEYEIEVSPVDPGFAETSLNIITIQSYPVVGGTWAVSFNTNGTADLVIRAINETKWSDMTEDFDLRFIAVKCNDTILPYLWINDSIIIQNYSCNETATETSKVLTKGKHALEFNFGGDIKYAFNNASDPWWNYSWMHRKQLNITNLNATVILPKDLSINITIDTSVANGFLSNGDDLRIVFFNGSTNIELDRFNETVFNSVSTMIWFKIQRNISAGGSDMGYYIYYNNSNASSPPTNQSNIWLWFDDFLGSSVDTSLWNKPFDVGWSVTSGELKGTTNTGRLASVANFSSGNILEIKSRYISMPGNGYQIGGFLVSTSNSIGFLSHPGTDYYRNNGGWTAIAATSPASTNLLTKLTLKSASAVDLNVTNYDTGVRYQAVANIANNVSNEPIALGRRYDDAITGQAYEAYWDWIRVRKYFAPGYSYSLLGSELLNISPTISSIQCFVVDVGWINCSSVVYGNTIQHVRANCTSNVGSTIQNATFLFRNINDNKTYFNDLVTESTDGYWQDGFVNIAVLDSGNFSLSITCSDSMYLNSTDVNWSIPFGTLSAELISPTTRANATLNRFFNFTSRITCVGGECGNVNATLDPPAGWWDNAWARRKQINITNIGSSSLVNFSVYLNITYDAYMQPDYDDLRFVNGNCSGAGGVILAYEIENYTGVKADIWIRIPALLVGVNNICMYYNNSNATSGENKVSTWDSNYVVVHHMQDFNASRILDSTSNARNGNKSAVNGPSQISGIVGSGQNFTNDNIQSPSLFVGSNAITSTLTVEAWIKPMNLSNGSGDISTYGQTILAHSPSGTYNFWLTQRGRSIWFESYTATALNFSKTPDVIMSTNSYYHVSASSTRNGQQLIYVNGINVANSTSGNTAPAASSFTMGDLRDGRLIFFNGTMDEVRVSNVIRSPDWINETYQLIANHGNLVSYGSSESRDKGVIPMNSGTPFYTTTQNPMGYGGVSCLENMGSASTCDTTWIVNATGDINSTWEFFTIYSSFGYPNDISNTTTSRVNITIMNASAPNASAVSIAPSIPNYATDLNCSFTIRAQDTFSQLSANITWYRNGTLAHSEILTGIQNGVQSQVVLGSGNLSVGEIWYCGVTPYDNYLYGAQVNSTNVTISPFIQPVINQIQCQRSSGSWVSCSNITYNTTLIQVRANCSGVDDAITNVTFTLNNIEHAKTYFSISTANTSGGYYIFNNSDITITESGTYNLTVECNDTTNLSITGYSQWTVPWGVLRGQLIDPVVNRNAAQYRYFNFTSRVTCTGGECGYVNATLDPVVWWNSSWRYRKQITINNSGSTSLNNFPVYLNITYSDNMSNNYSDIRFLNASCDGGGSLMAYEIENYTSSRAHIWVNIPDFSPGTNTICMYYGNPSTPQGANRTAVWDANYVVVHHMQDLNSTYILDSSINSRNGTKTSSGNPAQTASIIGNGQYFSSDNIQSGTLFSGSNVINNNFTVEAWIKPEYITNGTGDVDTYGQTILGHSPAGTYNIWLTQHGKDIWFESYTASSSAFIKSSNVILDTNSFYHVSATAIRNGAEYVYVNGISVATGTAGNTAPAASTFTLGDLRDARAIYFSGNMDEVRVSNVIRSPDWINQTYKLVGNYGSYISVGAEEQLRKGDIPMNSGSPFYTITQNPMNSSTMACLADMGNGSTCDTTWTVNATGELNSNWEFFVIYDSMNYSSYVATNYTPSVFINITGAVPPTISNISCLRNNATWVNCSSIVFGNNITSVRAICRSNMEGTVNNVSFMIKNINDNKIYFNVTTTNQSGGYYIYNNSNTTILDSGNFNVHVTCREGSVISEQDINWSIPFGTLSSQLISPSTSINVTQNKFFNFTARITCTGGECGYVNATLDPTIPWWDVNWIYRRQINISENNNTNLTNYQVNISINTSGLISSGKMMSDCSDMRFATNNSVELNYFIESGCNSNATIVWIRMNMTNSSNATIYMYYGNSIATAGSNGNNTFDLYDDFTGASINTSIWNITNATGWSVSGGELRGTSSTGMLTSHKNFSSDVVLEIKSRYVSLPTNGYQIGGFYLSTSNSVGFLNHPGTDYYRNDGGWTAMAATSPASTNLSTRITVKSASAVDINVTNFNTGARYQAVANIANTVSSERVVLGRRYDGTGYLGQAYDAYWDWIRVRKYSARIPTLSGYGSEEILSKGDIPMGSGNPFYTISQNPMTSLNTSCLANMQSGNSCNITWTVNATGTAGTRWEFFVIYGLMNYSANITAINSSRINITIIGNVAPSVATINISPAYPAYFNDLYCNFTVTDSNYFDALTANVSWYKNSVLSYSEILNVTNGVSVQRMLNSSNLSSGQTWYCAVTPYDGTSYGLQANSSNVTILATLPPSINSVQCQENNLTWGACSNVLYWDNLNAVRTNCTASGSTIANATFVLSNLEHNQIYFTGVVNTTSGGYYVYDNSDINITRSGTYNLSVTCIDANATSGSNSTLWQVPWGTLSSQLISPNASTNVTYNRFFNFTAQITCIGGECGYINATLDPSAAWWNLSWIYRKEFNVTERSNINLSNFQVNFTVNTTGLISTGKMKSDCSDMRFTDNNSVELGYLIESGCNSSSTIVWVKMNLTSNNRSTLYMYYGNPSASPKSDGFATFDMFDTFTGSSINTSIWTITDATGWSVASSELRGTSSTGMLTSVSTFSNGSILEIKSRYVSLPTNGYQIGGFYLSTANSVGFLNHPSTDYYRNDGGWTAMAATSPASTNLSTRITVKSSSYVDLTVTNYETGSSYQNVLDISNAVSSEPVVLGRRYDGTGYLGQAYDAYWDWIRVRKYASTMPNISIFGAEERQPKTDIPMGSGIPFYTISQNPTTSLNTSCLADMMKGNSCNITWIVNSTGDIGTIWSFYVIYKSTNFSSYVSSINSTAINITIINITAPSISSISLTPLYPTMADNLNCTFIEINSAPLDMLTANVTWYRNNIFYSSSIESVTSGVSKTVTLGSGNLSLGDSWKCGVTPSNQEMIGSQVNSSNVTVLSSTPPTINQVQCLVNGTTWTACSNIGFGDLLSGVRANCTNNNAITNVSFNFTNVPDAYNFFTNTTTSNTSDWWSFYQNVTINNSGEYRLYTTCFNNLSDSMTNLTNWSVQWGRFVITLINPNASANVQRYQFFNFTANVTCIGGECGDVNTTVDPASWWNSAWKYRVMINLSERNNTALTNFQVNLSINTSSLISSGKMTGNCSDIRFTDGNSRELSYYIFSGCNTTSTIIWVKANLTASTNTSIYMYYGNPSASEKSNGSATFDFFDDFLGSSVDTAKWNIPYNNGWNVTGGELRGVDNTGRLSSVATFSSGIILEIKSRYTAMPGNGYQIGGFLVSTSNSIGFLSHPGTDYYRNDGGWTAMAATAPVSVNLSTRIAVKSSSLVDINVTNYDTGVRYQAVGNIANTVSSEPIALGRRYDDAIVGQAYNASWDWIRIRKYAATEPSFTIYSEEVGKQDISTVVGATPFYTTTSNPMNYNTSACLRNMIAGTSCQVNWSINATGSANTTWEFFVYANSTTYPVYVTSNESRHINITIFDSMQVPPVTSLVYPNTSYYSNNVTVDFNCSATDNSGLSNMTLYLRKGLGLFLANGTNNLGGTSNSTVFSRQLQESNYVWNCLAYDSDGNTAFASSNRTLTIDTTAPTITLSAPSINGSFTTGMVVFNFTPNDNLDSSLFCNLSIDSVIVNSSLSTVAVMSSRTVNGIIQGIHNWNVTCMDHAGNINVSTTRQFTILGFLPNITLITPDNYTQMSTTINLQYNATDDTNISNASLYINGVLNLTNTTVANGNISSFTLSGLAEGRYNWTVNVTDIDGLTRQASYRTFIIDYSSPWINLSAPADNASINTSTAYFNFTVYDNINQSLNCNITVNDVVKLFNTSASFSVLTSKQVTNLSNGLNYWNVTCWDRAGNTNTSDTRMLNVSAVPSILINSPQDNYSQNTSTFTFNYTPTDASGFTKCDLYINGLFNQTNNTGVLNGQSNIFTLSDVNPGRYNWTINCTDTIGLTVQSPQRSFSMDVQKSSIALYAPQPDETIYGQGVMFNFTATDDFAPFLYCNLTLNNSVNLTNITAQNGTMTNVSISFSNQGTYYWNITCWDNAGNTNTSETRNFTMRIPPTVALLSPNMNQVLNYSENVVFTYTPTDAIGLNESILIFNGVRNQSNRTGLVNGFPNTFTVNMSDGVYFWTVNATSTSGLTGTATARNLTVDTTPPSVIYTRPYNTEAVGWNNVTFNFSAIDNLSNTMICNITVNGISEYSNINVSNGTPYVFYKVLSDGEYNWSVSCLDHANWTNSYTLVNFTVEAPPNVTLNSPISYYRTNATNITFNYTPRDAIGLQNCTLYYDGIRNATEIMIQKNQPNYFTLADLLPGEHNWTVECIDLAPDYNPFTPSSEFFIIDLTAPNITIINPGEGDFLNGNNVQFNWTAEDYNGTYINCSLSIDGSFNRSLRQLSGTYYAPLVNNMTDGDHSWFVNCSDDLGNYGLSHTYNFTINQPDLYLNYSMIFFNNTNPEENQTINITANVTNIGGVPVNNVLIEFWDGIPGVGIFIGNSTGNIGFNGSRIFSALWNITAGYHEIYVVADPYNAIGELDEINNNASKNISILRSAIINPANGSIHASANITVQFLLQDFTIGLINYSVYVDNTMTGQIGEVTDNSSSSINVTVPQGSHFIRIEARDQLGRRKNSSAVYVTVDYTAPVPIINTANNSWFNYSTPTINISATDNRVSLINYTLFVDGLPDKIGVLSNNTPELVNLSSLSNGTYTIILEVRDDFNNSQNSTAKIIYVDTVLPQISMNGPDELFNFTIRTAVLNYTATDNMASNLTCNLTLDGQYVDNRISNNNTPIAYTANNLQEGNHYWNVTCRDLAGNTYISPTRMFSVFISPLITLISPLNNQWSNNDTNIFLFNVSDDTGLENCSIIFNGIINQSKTNSQLINNNTNNFTVSSMSSGTYVWQIECYDNTSYRAYNLSGNRTLYVDTIVPEPFIMTANNSWFRTGTPQLLINISDNMDFVLNYTVYVNGTFNSIGSANNSTAKNTTLSALSNGTYSIILEALDQAGNLKNSTAIIISIDTVVPSINLTYPLNNSNITEEFTDLNFTVQDNLAEYLICNLTLDGSLNASGINLTNPASTNISVSGLNGGWHYWNVTCIDDAGNSNRSLTFRFFVVIPDLQVLSSNIFFSNENPIENETVTVTAQIDNVGENDASNFTVEIRLNTLTGTLLGNFSMSLLQNESQNVTVNYTLPLGSTTFHVIADVPLASNGSIMERNESNNNASRTLTVSSWHYILGEEFAQLAMLNPSLNVLYTWNVSNTSGGKIYATDSDSTINWLNLTAISRNNAGSFVLNDFHDMDLAFGIENNSDSVNRTYTYNNNPRRIQNLSLFNKNVSNVPFHNSTNNTNFLTGLLWDSGDGGAEFNRNQDIVLVTEVNMGAVGYNSTYDFEMRIPAFLRRYRAGVDAVALYAELN